MGATVNEILKFHAEKLQDYLKAELEIEQNRLLEKIFEKTLEQIFIENRLYKYIETQETYEKVHGAIEQGLKPFYKHLARIPTYEDREGLLSIQIRRISRFDIAKNEQEIAALQKLLEDVEKQLKNIKKCTIKYLQGLIKKYGPLFPRHTQIKPIEELDKRAISEKTLKVGYDSESGFIGTKISSSVGFECSNLEKLLILYTDGTYRVISIPEKQYIHIKDAQVIWIGIADKKTTFGVIYIDPKGYPYAKRFVIKQFILDKEYEFLDRDQKLEYITSLQGVVLELHFKPKPRQKLTTLNFPLEKVAIKGVSAKGARIANKEFKKIKIVEKGE